MIVLIFLFEQKTSYEISGWLAFRRVLFLFQAEDGIRDHCVTGVQTCAFPISSRRRHTRSLCDWSSDVCSSDLFGLASRRRHTRSLCDWSSDVCSSDLRLYRGLQHPAAYKPRWGNHQEAQKGCGGVDKCSRPTNNNRSEERRVGKECRSRWSP